MFDAPRFEPLRVPASREINLIAAYRDKCAYFRRMLYHSRKAVFKSYLQGACSEKAACARVLEKAEEYYACMTNGAKGSIADPPAEAAEDMQNFLRVLLPEAGLKEQYEGHFDRGYRKMVYADPEFPKPWQ